MGKMSKDKGRRFEQVISRRLKKAGIEKAHRTAQYCGQSPESADVVGLDGYHIECKHQEKMHLYDWMNQSIRDAEGTENIPIVIHKQNRKPILVTMLLDDFLVVVSRDSQGGGEVPQKSLWYVTMGTDGSVVSVSDTENEAGDTDGNTTFAINEFTAERAVQNVESLLDSQQDKNELRN